LGLRGSCWLTRRRWGFRPRFRPWVERVDVEIIGRSTLIEAPVDVGFAGTAGPIAVSPGDQLRLFVVVDEYLQFAQAMYIPFDFLGDAFGLVLETLRSRVHTVGPITNLGPLVVEVPAPIILEVDEDAPPGPARALLVVSDERGAENVVRVEFDVQ
jgi:hypothetical protein